MSLHCVWLCLNYRRQSNERGTLWSAPRHLSESYWAGAEAKALSCLCEWPQQSDRTLPPVPVTLPDVCQLCRGWPFGCKSRCSRRHVQHAFTFIWGRYWSVSWSNPLAVETTSIFPQAAGLLDVFMNLSTPYISHFLHTLLLTVRGCASGRASVRECNVCLCTHIFVHYPNGFAYAVTLGEWGDIRPWLAPPLEQPRIFINTSEGPQHSRFKVIFRKLSFWAWSNPSLPFTLLPDRVFLYRFIKLIPFLPGLWKRSEWIIPHRMSWIMCFSPEGKWSVSWSVCCSFCLPNSGP